METQIFYGIISCLLGATVGLLIKISSSINRLTTQVAVIDKELEKGTNIFNDHEQEFATLSKNRRLDYIYLYYL